MSDKKKLLEEGTIRRFQALANIKPLNSEYSEVLEEAAAKKGGHSRAVQMRGDDERAPKTEKMHKKGNKVEEKKKHVGAEDEAVEEAKYAEEESMEEAKYAEEESLEEVGHGYEEGSYGYEETAMPMAEEEMGGEGGEVKSAVESFLQAAQALIDMIPQEGGEKVEIGVEDEEGESEGEPMDMGAPEEEEEGTKMMQEKKHHKKGMAEKEEKGKKPAKHDKLKESVDEEEALAEELTRRVAARLVAEMRKAQAHKATGKKMKGLGEVGHGTEAQASGKGATKAHGKVDGHGGKHMQSGHKAVSAQGLAGKGGGKG